MTVTRMNLLISLEAVAVGAAACTSSRDDRDDTAEGRGGRPTPSCDVGVGAEAAGTAEGGRPGIGVSALPDQRRFDAVSLVAADGRVR